MSLEGKSKTNLTKLEEKINKTCLESLAFGSAMPLT